DRSSTTAAVRPTRNRSCATSPARSCTPRTCWSRAPASECRCSPATRWRSTPSSPTSCPRSRPPSCWPVRPVCSWPMCRPRSRQPARTPASWAGSEPTRRRPPVTAWCCSSATTTFARAPRSTPYRSRSSLLHKDPARPRPPRQRLRAPDSRTADETDMTDATTTTAGGPDAPGRVGLIGAGVMGETVLAGLLRAGWAAEDVVATDRRPERCAELTDRYGIATTDNLTAVREAATVVLVVKPQDLVSVLDEIAPALRPGSLVVSVVAGVPTDLIESRLPEATPVVRVMPNTPARVAEGMSVVSPGRHATDNHVATVQRMLSTTGRV